MNVGKERFSKRKGMPKRERTKEGEVESDREEEERMNGIFRVDFYRR